MLTLTRKTEYALIAVCHLARVGDKTVSARDIADEHGVPLPLLMNVLKRLNRTGHVHSTRGARGGYLLAVRPEEFSLRGLIAAVEGPVYLVRCANPDKNGRRCTLPRACSIQRSVHKVDDQLRKFLEGVTIADIAFDERHARPADVARVLAR